MVIALFILMVVILLTAEYFSLSKKIASEAKKGRIDLPLSTQIIERYFHRGHSWALVEHSNTVTAGVDDFAQRFIGKVDTIELPQIGSKLRKGERMVTMKHGEKSLSPVSPISGTVVAVNSKLTTSPSTINDSPFEKGWIVKLTPIDLTTELRTLLKGIVAERWQEAVRAHMIHWFSPRFGTVMQDGGELVDNVSDVVTKDEWRMLVDEFFPKNYNDPNNNNF